MEAYEDVIEKQVQLSFFVPLIIGHGGNTGTQTVSSLIRCGGQQHLDAALAAGVRLLQGARTAGALR